MIIFDLCIELFDAVYDIMHENQISSKLNVFWWFIHVLATPFLQATAGYNAIGHYTAIPFMIIHNS